MESVHDLENQRMTSSHDFGSSLGPNSATSRDGSSITDCAISVAFLIIFPFVAQRFSENNPFTTSEKASSVSEIPKRKRSAAIGKIAKRAMIWRVEHLRGKVDMICARIKSAQRHDSVARIGEGKTWMYMVDSPKVDIRVKVQAWLSLHW